MMNGQFTQYPGAGNAFSMHVRLVRPFRFGLAKTITAFSEKMSANNSIMRTQMHTLCRLFHYLQRNQFGPDQIDNADISEWNFYTIRPLNVL